MQKLEEAEFVQAVQDALECMCFVFTEILEEASPEGLVRHVALELEAEDETSRLFLSSDDDFLIELASSLLGSEPEEVDAQSDGVEALKEIINVFGGELSRLLGGADREISTGIPHFVTDVPTESDIDTCFDSMGSCFRLRLLRLQPE